MASVRSPFAAVVAATLVVLAAAAPAGAQGGPAKVTIRVEGAGRTLVPLTMLTTGAAPVDKGGAPCSGTSAGGALEQATRGAWSGPVVPDVGQTVQTILGETHAGEDPRRFVLQVNSVPTSMSPCALELNPGDSVVFFVSAEPPRKQCRTDGRDGLCGTPDRTAPVAEITSIKEQQRFTRATAPRTLRGLVGADPSGVADVRLRLTRVIGGTRCAYFDGIEDTFQRTRSCRAGSGRFFSIPGGRTWAWNLPAKLTRGRYTLDVRAVDGMGNSSTVAARGRDRIVFVVSDR